MKAALQSVHGEEGVEGSSFYDMADEVAGTHRGMTFAIPEDEWAVFHGLTAALGGILLDLAAGVCLSSYRKQGLVPRHPQPERESRAKVKYDSTEELLEKKQGST